MSLSKIVGNEALEIHSSSSSSSSFILPGITSIFIDKVELGLFS